MKYAKLIKSIAGMAMLCSGVPTVPAAVVVSLDMDTTLPGIQPTRLAAVNDIFTVALVMTALMVAGLRNDINVVPLLQNLV